METGQAEKTIDLVDAFEMLFRHLPVILLCTVLAAVAGFAGTFFFASPGEPETVAPPEDPEVIEMEDPYTATALLMVRRDPLLVKAGDAESSAEGETEGNAAYTLVSASDRDQVPAQLVNTYSYLTRSEVVLSQVIKELDLDVSCRQLLSLGGITTQVMDASPIYELAVTLPGKELALDVCRSITRIAPDTAAELVGTGKVEVILPAHVITEDVPEEPEENAEEPEATAQAAAQGVPPLARNTALMAALGFFACVCVLFARFMLDNKINRAADVEQYLDMQVLGIIPMYEGENR